MIHKHQWVQLIRKSPKQLHPLLNMCAKYSEFLMRLRRINPYATIVEYSDMTAYLARITTLYKELIHSKFATDKDIMKQTDEHIQSSLKPFYDKDGDRMEESRLINIEIEKGTLNSFIILRADLVSDFIYSSIQDSIQNTLEKAEGFIMNDFTNSLVSKMGVLPEHNRYTQDFDLIKKDVPQHEPEF